ncbi:MAG: hypothetical protein FWF08_02920 [Oscillospiraceae bacterium]|nr:hypothetical protein [Oscillospiraceae bacterium]
MAIDNLPMFFIMLAAAGSYGWAVRGTTLGKERGAMLPGAMLGLLLAWFSGSALLRERFWLFAAAGALGMFVGGCETYAQTMEFVKDGKKSPKPLKGNLGLALKGALWFGIAGAVLGISFSSAAGFYKISEIILLFALMPILRGFGIRIANRPFDPENGVFPRIYISRNRPEEWGGMVMMLLELIVFMAAKGDRFALYLCVFGMLGGSVGWVMGINMMHKSLYPMNSKNSSKGGKYIFGSMQTKGMIDNWKIMENTLGAVGFIGIGAGFALAFPELQKHIAVIESGGLWQPLGGREFTLSWAMFGLAIGIDFLAGLLYLLLKKKLPKNTERIGDITQQVVYTYLSIPLVLLGAQRYSELVCVFLLYWVLMVELVSNGDKMPKVKGGWKFSIFIIAAGAALLVYQIMCGGSFTMLQPWLLYTAVYFIYQIAFYDLLPHKVKAIKEKAKEAGGLKISSFGPLSTVEGFKLVEIIFMSLYLFKG